MVFETNPLFQAGVAPVLPQLLGGGNGYDDAGSNDDDGDEDDHMIVVMVAMTRYLHQGFLIRIPGHDGGCYYLKG